MQLRRIRLRNIRSHPSTDVRFGPGTTLITGDVGSGKTSLLYGVELALFGFAEVDAAYLVRHESREAEVRLELGDDGTTIEIERRLKRSTRGGRSSFEIEEARLATGGRPTSYSATELRKRVIELLGFPDNPSPRARSDVWRWAVYVPQERMREVLDLKPADRLETVRKALGLELYRTAAENARELLAPRLRSDAETLDAQAEELHHFEVEREQLAGEVATLSARIRELVRRETEAHAAVEDARARVQTTADRTAERQADAARAEELAAVFRDQLERLRRLELEAQDGVHREEEARSRLAALGETERTAIALRSDLDGLATEREGAALRLRDIEGVAAEVAALREEHAGRAAALRAVADQRVTVEAEVARTDERLAAAAAARPTKEPPVPTRRTVVELDAAIRRAEEGAQRLAIAVGRSKAALVELEELLSQGTCPRCHQTVEPGRFASHRAEAAGEVAATEAELARSETERAALAEERSSRERYDRALDRWVDRERVRADAVAESSRARAEQERIGVLVARAELDATSIGERLRALGPRSEDRERAVRELAALDEQLKPLIDWLRDVEESERQRAAFAEELRAEERSATLLREQIGTESARVEESEARLSQLRGRLSQTAAVAEEHRTALESLDRATHEEREIQNARVAGDQQLLDRRGRYDAAERGIRRRAELGALSAHRRSLARWVAGPFSEALELIERRRLATSQAMFEGSLARYFGALVEDPGMAARCGTSFAPAVEIEGEWTPPEALSGGERTALGLAFRLALGDVVRSAGRLQLETLILDEPTDGFSPEQVVRMGELLESLAIRQVILVSHEGGLGAFADRVVRVRKDEGISHVEPSEGALPEPTPVVGAAAEPEVARAIERTRPRRRRRRLEESVADAPPAS
ncbi:MAG TPA: SMC family ATPase [Thermoplasmata archaeon]|nr:SMC family ATPase [Thermoplasmata archaeon]